MSLLISRRRLLQLSAGASALALVKVLDASGASAGSTRWGPRQATLVLLELKGGNDGLNTIAPIDDPVYQRARQELALKSGIPLGGGLVMHPGLAPLEPSLRNGRLSWVLGVGWEKPNRSHFKAMDQWATGNPVGEGPGWLAREVRTQGIRGPLVALGPSGSAALEGDGVLSVQMSPELLRASEGVTYDPSIANNNPALAQLLELERDGIAALRMIRNELPPPPSDTSIPGTELGRQLILALRLIGSGVSIPVIQVSQGGYDTHSNQSLRHGRALEHLAGALAGFERGLKQMGGTDNVSLLAYSEFGRRLKPNASGGTDHGSASVALMLNDFRHASLIGDMPSLSRLDERGDLIPTQSAVSLQSLMARRLS